MKISRLLDNPPTLLQSLARYFSLISLVQFVTSHFCKIPVKILLIFQPQRQPKQRPRIPPPSKIPSSAVEMPGDAVNSSIGILDVQFGAMDFGADTNSLDAPLSDKYTTSTTIPLPESNSNSNTSNTANSTSNSLDLESVQTANQYNTSSQMVIIYQDYFKN